MRKLSELVSKSAGRIGQRQSIPGHIHKRESRVDRDKMHPVKGAGFQKLEGRRCSRVGCASLNRRPVVELRGIAFEDGLSYISSSHVS